MKLLGASFVTTAVIAFLFWSSVGGMREQSAPALESLLERLTLEELTTITGRYGSEMSQVKHQVVKSGMTLRGFAADRVVFSHSSDNPVEPDDLIRVFFVYGDVGDDSAVLEVGISNGTLTFWKPRSYSADLLDRGVVTELCEERDQPASRETRPPWIAFPETDRYDDKWYESDMQAYLRSFILHWKQLSEDGKDQFAAANPAPERWDGWYDAPDAAWDSVCSNI